MGLPGLRAAGTRAARRRGEQIEHPAAIGAGAASGDASHQLAVVDLQLHHRVERLPEGLEQVIERVRLGEVARKAIENEPLAGVRLLESLANHPEHQGVVHQAAAVHGLLGLPAKFGALGDRSPQQVPGGDLRDADTLHEALRLGALAGAGGP